MNGLSMKKIMVIGIFMGAVGICLLFGTKIQGALCGKIYVLSFAQENMFFTVEDMTNIENEGIDMTYTQRIFPKVSNGFRREEIPVIVTNENYVYFTNTHIESGSFFNGIQADKKIPLVAINTVAANQLFGNRNCVGETVYLNQVSYEVIGIMEEKNIDEARIYIPYSTIEYLNLSDLEIEQIWCQFSNLAEAALTLGKAGYPLETLSILQMDLVKRVFRQRLVLPFVLVGIFTVLYVSKSILKRVKGLKWSGRLNRKLINIGIVQAIDVCVGICFIWMLIKISWCVPPNYELIGKSWKKVLHSILDFYSLSNIAIDNMPYFTQWNLDTLILMSMNLIIVICFFMVCLFKSGSNKNAGENKL